MRAAQQISNLRFSVTIDAGVTILASFSADESEK
jgi:hypothetical protein